MARQKGSRNATHTHRQERLTTTINPALKSAWQVLCLRNKQKMAERLEMLIVQDLQQAAPAESETTK